MPAIWEEPDFDDHELVQVVRDRASGLTAIIALHSTHLGPGAGGTAQAALLPLALGPSEGSIIAAELGTVVIGGLLSSTLLTLLVVPVVYSLVDGLKESLSRGKRVKAA